jgi:hypothetical protein
LNDNFSKIDVAIKSGTGGGGGGTSIEDGSITTPKIANNAVTIDKVSKDIQESLDKADSAVQQEDVPTKLSQLTQDVPTEKARMICSTWFGKDSSFEDGVRYTRISAADAGTLPCGENANAIMTISLHETGKYTHQIGFTSKGLFHRRVSNSNLSDNIPWKKVALFDDVNDDMSKYLPKTGGEVKGVLTLKAANPLVIDMSSYGQANIQLKNNNGATVSLGYASADYWYLENTKAGTFYKLLHSGNYSDFALPKTGGEVTGNTAFIGDTIVKVLDYGAVTISGDSSKEDGMTLRFSRIDGNKSYGQILFQSGNGNGVKIASEWATWANRNNLVIYTSNNTTAPYDAVWEKSFEVTYDGKVKIFKKLITPSITLNNKEITELYSKTEVDAALNKKQESLIDNVNIKTINGQSILGSGDITIRGDGSDMAVVSVSLDVSQLTVGSYVTITREQYEKILLSRKGYCVVIADANFTGNYAYDESEWGQVISCYRQYFGSSAFKYRLSVIHHAGDMGSNTPPNTQIYTMEFIDMTTGGMASSTNLYVRAINNLY